MALTHTHTRKRRPRENYWRADDYYNAIRHMKLRQAAKRAYEPDAVRPPGYVPKVVVVRDSAAEWLARQERDERWWVPRFSGDWETFAYKDYDGTASPPPD